MLSPPDPRYRDEGLGSSRDPQLFAVLTWANARIFIPRISRDQRPMAAFRGIRLHRRRPGAIDQADRFAWSEGECGGERRVWDSNPRERANALAVFKTAAIVH
jgi:hypothetical protein